MSLVADVREPEDLKKFADEVQELDVDYFITGSVRKYCIERKTVSDLMSSAIDGRLWNQLDYLKQLKDQGYIPIVVIEGIPSVVISKMKRYSWKQFFGVLIGVASFGVTVVQLPSKNLLKLFLDMLKHKSGKKTKFSRPTLRKPERTIEQERADMFSVVEGVGIRTAEKLIAKFGTPKYVCNLRREELIEAMREIMGSGEKDIGGKVGEHLCRVIGIE